jgi:hypothetical protein
LLTREVNQSSVSYYRGTGANAAVLYRRECSGAVAAPPSRVIRNLSPAIPPSFTCVPTPCSAAWQVVTATGTFTTVVQGSRRAD